MFFLCVCIKLAVKQKDLLRKKNYCQKYTDNKIHIINVCRKFTDKDVIWVKVIDLQKILCHRNLCHAAMKKFKSFCCTKPLLKNKLKNTKEK